MPKKHKHHQSFAASPADLRPRIERRASGRPLPASAGPGQAAAQARTDAGQSRIAQGRVPRPCSPTARPGADARCDHRPRRGAGSGRVNPGVAGALGRGDGPVRRHRADAGLDRTDRPMRPAPAASWPTSPTPPSSKVPPAAPPCRRRCRPISIAFSWPLGKPSPARMRRPAKRCKASACVRPSWNGSCCCAACKPTGTTTTCAPWRTGSVWHRSACRRDWPRRSAVRSTPAFGPRSRRPRRAPCKNRSTVCKARPCCPTAQPASDPGRQAQAGLGVPASRGAVAGRPPGSAAAAAAPGRLLLLGHPRNRTG